MGIATDLHGSIVDIFKKDEKQRFFSADGSLLRNAVYEATMSMDKDLIKLLLSDKKIKETFFEDIDGVLVFDKVKFGWTINNKQFLPDSYTRFKNKIGLVDENNQFISNNGNMVLSFPYKDCILEGGQTKEDQKRGEIFYNELLAPDEVDRLLAPKVFTNAKKYSKDGEEKITKFNDTDNLLIKGNNLLAISSLLERYEGKIKLIYIDPPYNTGSDGFNYNDNFNHSSWLVFMKNRLQLAKKLLRTDGFIFMQINDNEFSYLKVLCDEIFGKENFETSITVKMSHLSGTKMAHKDKKIPKIKEHILMYSKNTENTKLNPVYTPVSWDEAFDRYNSFLLKDGFDDTNCDKWYVITLNQAYEKNNIDKDKPKEVLKFNLNNAHLIFRTARNRSADYSNLPFNKFSKIEKENKTGFAYKGEDVNFASEKIQTIEGKKTPVSIIGDIWTDIGINNLSNEGGVSLRFGKKPEKLIERIIKLTCNNPDDIILDFFAGSGTTASVAHKMGKQWITVEQLDYEENDSIKRMKNVLSGEQSGISKTINWQGGGSFIYCELKENNQQFIDKILQADNDKNLSDLLQQILATGFISYKVNVKDINDNESEFEKLSIEDKKKFLLELLDKNMLYVNYCDIDDEDFNISEKDKAFTKSFYEVK